MKQKSKIQESFLGVGGAGRCPRPKSLHSFFDCRKPFLLFFSVSSLPLVLSGCSGLPVTAQQQYTCINGIRVPHYHLCDFETKSLTDFSDLLDLEVENES